MGRLRAFWIMVLSIVLLAGCTPSTTPRPTPTVIAPRQIAGGTLALREYYRRSGVFIGGGGAEHRLLAVDEKLIYAQVNTERGTSHLEVLNAMTGTLLWETGEKDVSDIAADSEQVYLYSKSDSQIEAYRLEDGQYLWTIRTTPHQWYFFYTEGDVLYVHNLDSSEFCHFDARSGAQLECAQLKSRDGFPLLARFPEFDLYRTHRTLRAVARVSQQLLWETPVKFIRDTHVRPTLCGDVLLVGEQFISGIDIETGIIRWDNWDRLFASNYVVVNRSVYGIDWAARLVQLDIETGRETGYLQFTPERINASHSRYWITSDGKILFIAFDDSAELIALGP